jgi:hypothetical protein
VNLIAEKTVLFLIISERLKKLADVIPYNNRNDGGPAAGLLSLIEVSEKAIVPFMVNAFDYMTFITFNEQTWRILKNLA